MANTKTQDISISKQKVRISQNGLSVTHSGNY